ncbi:MULTISPECIES: shikimate kinase [Rhodomicrobium]|uniref:shikimate kinase n=1 Tax=Rhodomicrobium TaxID=1068 RepID=UPI001FD8D4F4|nr:MULTISPECIES: shikimate kinase [Rhodomicrobium]
MTNLIEKTRQGLGKRPVVLIGLMGAGKSAIGKRLAATLDLPFADADQEIERAAGKTINEIFEENGEAYFRDGERRVIARLLDEGSKVLATGGGAFMNEETRARIAATGVSVWLKAELDLLMHRVARRDTRPLLRASDPRAVMEKLIAERYPIYALADITVASRDVAHEVIVGEIIEALAHSPKCAGEV